MPEAVHDAQGVVVLGMVDVRLLEVVFPHWASVRVDEVAYDGDWRARLTVADARWISSRLVAISSATTAGAGA